MTAAFSAGTLIGKYEIEARFEDRFAAAAEIPDRSGSVTVEAKHYGSFFILFVAARKEGKPVEGGDFGFFESSGCQFFRDLPYVIFTITVLFSFRYAMYVAL